MRTWWRSKIWKIPFIQPICFCRSALSSANECRSFAAICYRSQKQSSGAGNFLQKDSKRLLFLFSTFWLWKLSSVMYVPLYWFPKTQTFSLNDVFAIIWKRSLLKFSFFLTLNLHHQTVTTIKTITRMTHLPYPYNSKILAFLFVEKTWNPFKISNQNPRCSILQLN